MTYYYQSNSKRCGTILAVLFVLSIYAMFAIATIVFILVQCISIGNSAQQFNFNITESMFQSALTCEEKWFLIKETQQPIRTCYIQRTYQVNSSLLIGDEHLVSVFYSSAVPFDLYYFKGVVAFSLFNASGVIDPFSVNYFLSTRVRSGFKQLDLSLKDDLEIPVPFLIPGMDLPSTEGLQFAVRLYTFNDNSTTNYGKFKNNLPSKNSSLDTITELELKDRYVPLSEITFPLSISLSYYIETSSMEKSIYILVSILCLFLLFLFTLTCMTRFKRLVSSSGELIDFLPITLQRVFRIYSNRTNDFDFWIQFNDLSFKSFETAEDSLSLKTILHPVSGVIPPGSFVAIMGESGSGKTTFINCLTKRITGGISKGTVSISGFKVDSESMKRLFAVVPQSDIIHPFMTPKQSFLVSSMIKNVGASHSKIVETVLEVLQLEQHANTLNEKLSGGQKKRVNIGLELVTIPKILILDEPTTGLDVTTANELCRSLRDFATYKQNKTVMAVIHQPSLTAFNCFTHLMLFKEGKLLRFDSLDRIKHEIASNHQYYISPDNISADQVMQYIYSKHEKNHFVLSQYSSPHAAKIYPQSVSTFLVQSLAIMYRTFIQMRIDWFYFIVDILLNAVAGLLIGILFVNNRNHLYVGSPNKDIALNCPVEKMLQCSSPQMDHISSVTSLLVLGISLTSSMSALRVFGREKLNFDRESQSGLNSLVYFIVKDVLAFSQMVLVSLSFTSLFYLMVLPNMDFGFYFGILLCLSIISFPIGYSISIILRDELTQITTAVVIFLFYMFSGASVSLPSLSDMSQPFPLLPYISYIRYIREILFVYELNTNANDYYINKSLNQLGYSWNNKWFLFIICSVFAIGLRCIAYLLLWQSRPQSFTKRISNLCTSLWKVMKQPFDLVISKVKELIKKMLKKMCCCFK
ncbi:predicted protein [Naegleria gruberi]|uniref:Predicted protein n=1 Tax=Naegleria gruberi TaxID=5762 RepID=D2VBP6_NAEGR|nr:uncharacterized protein NAEGRDRAFT_79337 [Naegleria gruberi]EFC45832.1 predicted protein [Naegleria gruberi]|eukprot:XP_002678576.1 predicted protein [Naegleria gruberi strain NEG-M]